MRASATPEMNELHATGRQRLIDVARAHPCAAGKPHRGRGRDHSRAVGIRPDLVATDHALSEQCLGPGHVQTAREWALERGYDWAAWEPVSYTPERMLLTLA